MCGLTVYSLRILFLYTNLSYGLYDNQHPHPLEAKYIDKLCFMMAFKLNYQMFLELYYQKLTVSSP